LKKREIKRNGTIDFSFLGFPNLENVPLHLRVLFQKFFFRAKSVILEKKGKDKKCCTILSSFNLGTR
jgi:hypothetical protein